MANDEMDKLRRQMQQEEDDELDYQAWVERINKQLQTSKNRQNYKMPYNSKNMKSKQKGYKGRQDYQSIPYYSIGFRNHPKDAVWLYEDDPSGKGGKMHVYYRANLGADDGHAQIFGSNAYDYWRGRYDAVKHTASLALPPNYKFFSSAEKAKFPSRQTVEAELKKTFNNCDILYVENSQ
jgi:hypothetical protein